MEYFDFSDILNAALLIVTVLVICLGGFVLSISAHKILSRFKKPKPQSREHILIEHISRVYESAKDGVYGGDMKSALDGLQELRNIACEQIVLNHQTN